MDIFSFDRDKWAHAVQHRAWYMEVPKLLEDLKSVWTIDPARYEVVKEEVYSFFEEKLKSERIVLGTSTGVFDTERKPIDTIVIHHTSGAPGMTKERLSAIELVRLYAPNFAKPVYSADQHIQGKLLVSGHVREGRQVFYPYHWMVRGNGEVERLLLDTEVGWHAGDWGVNCRSVAIAFDDDHEHKHPSRRELESAAKIITGHYSHVPKERVFGHREINPRTTCPSNFFLSTASEKGWKENLLELL